MGYFIYFIYLIMVSVQGFFAYGTAYRLTKQGSDNGIALYGWLFAMGFASLVPGLGIYLWYKYREEPYEQQENIDDQKRSLEKRVREFENKERTNTMQCPLCGEKIIKNSKYCRFCGGNVEENLKLQQKKAQEKMQEKLAQHGLGALFNDDKIINEAMTLRRLYGKNACISYLKGKARESGIDDIEITEEDLDSLL